MQQGHANGHDRDHVPSKAALLKRAEQLKRAPLTKKEISAIERGAEAVTIPKVAHQKASRTYGRRNSSERIKADSGNLAGAAKNDIKSLNKEMYKYSNRSCRREIAKATNKILMKSNADYDKFIDNILKNVK